MKSNKSKKLAKLLALSISGAAIGATPVMTVLADEVTDLTNQKNNAQSEIDNLQEELTNALEQIDNLESEAAKINDQMEKANADLKVAEEKQKKQEQDMKLRIQYMYENKNNTVEEALITSTDMSDALNKAEYAQKMYDYDRKALEELDATTKQIKELQSQLESDMAELASSQQEYQDKKQQLLIRELQLRTSIHRLHQLWKQPQQEQPQLQLHLFQQEVSHLQVHQVHQVVQVIAATQVMMTQILHHQMEAAVMLHIVM